MAVVRREDPTLTVLPATSFKASLDLGVMVLHDINLQSMPEVVRTIRRTGCVTEGSLLMFSSR